MFDYKKCPQDTDHYCPHYKSECEDAKKDRVKCVHVVPLVQSSLALTAVTALAVALNQESLVTTALKEAFEKMAIAPELKLPS